MIMVGPDFVEALSIADRIVVVDIGMKVQQVGKPNEIFEYPNNVFVANLIGEPRINLFECDIQSESGKLYFAARDLKVEVPQKSRQMLSKVKTGEKIILGVRAADIKAVLKEGNHYEAKGVITITEPLGWSTLVECKVGDKIVNFFSEDQQQNRGQHLYLEFDTEKLHVFEKDSGVTLC